MVETEFQKRSIDPSSPDQRKGKLPSGHHRSSDWEKGAILIGLGASAAWAIGMLYGSYAALFG